MPGRPKICILCRSISRAAQIPPRGGRAASHLRSLEPYDASKLVLDLDAADCKFVRRYEDEPRAVNAQEYNSSQKLKSEPKVEKKYLPHKVADVNRPAPIDFLTYAFWGDARGIKPTSRQIFRRVTSHCLRRRVGAYEDRTKWLFAYEVLPYKMDRIYTLPYTTTLKVRKNVRRIFHGCKTIYDVRRITALMTRNPDGCKFVAKYATFILNKLRLQGPRRRRKEMSKMKYIKLVMRKLEGPQSRRRQRATLMYINSVIQRLETMGVDPGPGWYGAGMYHSAFALDFPALKNYIDIALSKDGSSEKIDYTDIRTTLEFLFDFSTNKNILTRFKDSDPIVSLKPDILRILTGWDKEGVPQNGEIQQNCFAMLLGEHETITRLYFKILIRLRVDSALYHELNHGCLAMLMNNTGGRGDLTLSWRNEIKVQVLLHFKQPLQALQLLLLHKQILTDRKSSEVERTATANPPYSSRRNLPRTLVSTLAKKYTIRPVFDIDERSLSEDLEEANLYTPQTMSRILRMLSTFWPLHYDRLVRKIASIAGPNAPVYLNAVGEINRRLKIIEEVDEEQYDGFNMVTDQKDVENLKQLQADLQSLSFWSEAEDDLLKTLVKESFHRDSSENKIEENWEVMADKIAELLPQREISKGVFICEFLRRRYRRLMWTENKGVGMVKAEVKSRNDKDEADEYDSIDVLNDIDATRSP